MKKSVIALFVAFAVICALCDPTRASPSARVRRQGWQWNDDDGLPTRDTTRRPRPRPVDPTAGTTSTTTTTSAPTEASSPGGDGGTTTASPAFAACFAACQSTPQYNPVCASNRVTYDNEQKLNCARRCGLGVTKLFNGTC